MEELDFIFWALLIGGSMYMVVSFFSLVITGWRDIKKQSKAIKLIKIQRCKTKKLSILGKIGLWETAYFKLDQDLINSLESRLIVLKINRVMNLNIPKWT